MFDVGHSNTFDDLTIDSPYKYATAFIPLLKMWARGRVEPMLECGFLQACDDERFARILYRTDVRVGLQERSIARCRLRWSNPLGRIPTDSQVVALKRSIPQDADELIALYPGFKESTYASLNLVSRSLDTVHKKLDCGRFTPYELELQLSDVATVQSIYQQAGIDALVSGDVAHEAVRSWRFWNRSLVSMLFK